MRTLELASLFETAPPVGYLVMAAVGAVFPTVTLPFVRLLRPD